MLDIKEYLVRKADTIVNGARRKKYGTPERNFDRIARLWNAHLINMGIFDEDSGPRLTGRDVSSFMRLMKEARRVEAPDYCDNYVDIIGYTLTDAEINGVAVPAADVDEIARDMHEDSLFDYSTGEFKTTP